MLAVLSWSGMRGAVTLAAALALPLTTDAGSPFPQRNLVIFLAFTVIVVTLVVQGLTLPALVRAVDLPTDPREQEEEALAWVAGGRGGAQRVSRSCTRSPGSIPASSSGCATPSGCGSPSTPRARDGEKDQKLEKHVRASRRLRRELLDAERAALVELRRAGEISDAVERRVRRELDFEDARLGGGD